MATPGPDGGHPSSETSGVCLEGTPFFWPAAGGGASWRGAAVARRGLARLGPSSARLSAACGGSTRIGAVQIGSVRTEPGRDQTRPAQFGPAQCRAVRRENNAGQYSRDRDGSARERRDSVLARCAVGTARHRTRTQTAQHGSARVRRGAGTDQTSTARSERSAAQRETAQLGADRIGSQTVRCSSAQSTRLGARQWGTSEVH